MNKIKQFVYDNAIAFLLAGALGALFFSILALTVSERTHTVYVVFDMQGTVKAFGQQLAATSLTDNQQSELTGQFLQFIKEDTAAYANSHHTIILVSGAVVAGNVPNITQNIQQQVAKQVQAIWPVKGGA